MTDEREHGDTTAQPPDWDARAARFDDEPDHGLRDPAVRAAWAARLSSWLPGHPAEVLCGPAEAPPVGEHRFDVILVRHVLWALPGQARALRRWRRLLRPGGRFVLVEGVWGELHPVGIPADRLLALLAPLTSGARVERLSGDSVLWGKEVTDERYAVVAGV
ncbi:methyltransferase domain-containing protein [Streptomyces sp. SUK 48]|uniref:methyltransferase domain-containing protein n=1 Tax=Streptomyces sp. SUK 48 TaxID=2582831 RepID=UPI00129B0DF0|nr:methyltransferase domain-containing protein [Streptomyces sp. SUK 48]